jgi:hypothetical protein
MVFGREIRVHLERDPSMEAEHTDRLLAQRHLEQTREQGDAEVHALRVGQRALLPGRLEQLAQVAEELELVLLRTALGVAHMVVIAGAVEEGLGAAFERKSLSLLQQRLARSRDHHVAHATDEERPQELSAAERDHALLHLRLQAL